MVLIGESWYIRPFPSLALRPLPACATRHAAATDFPRQVPRLYGLRLPYVSFHRRWLSLSHGRETPMRSYLIATGLTSSLITLWIGLLQVIAYAQPILQQRSPLG